jgi:hypothetical protein
MIFRPLRIVELAALTLFAELGLSAVAQAILSQGYLVGEAGSIARLILIVVSGVLLGFWLQYRFASSVAELSFGVALGVIVAFVVRALTGEVPYFPSDLSFTVGLIVFSVCVILVGVWLGRNRLSPDR